MATRITIQCRKRSRSTDQRDPVQFYRPTNIPSSLHELLERKDLEEEDILTFISTGNVVSKKHASSVASDPREQAQMEAYNQQVQSYRKRRVEIQSLLQKVQSRDARVDEDGRLVETPAETQQPQVPVPPAPNPPVPVVPPPPPFILQPVNNLLENEEEQQRQRQWIEEEEREAAAAIARAVARYRRLGNVDWEDLQLVQQVQPHQENIRSFTFRRICFAVLAVVIAFICIMIQTMPLWENPYNNEEGQATMDPLVYQILQVRTVEEHERYCPGLDRENRLTWGDRLWQVIGLRLTTNLVDCSNGVLHIPPTNEMARLQLTRHKTWFFPCQHVLSSSAMNSSSSTCYPAFRSFEIARKDECGAEQVIQPQNQCFRGIHDDFLTYQETNDALRMGSTLISLGGDHFDIHSDVSVLQAKLPSILAKLRRLLTETYYVPSNLRPIAFRVNAVAPMDGDRVPLYGLEAATHPLIRLLNRTRYLRWMRDSMQHNEYVAQYYSSLPWPFGTSLSSANRDACNLMADMQADPRFSILTSIFLSDGAGQDFKGGVALFVDDVDFLGASDASASRSFRRKNRRPTKIRRGLTIDGSRGRLMVSTGGLENQRCRLPTRSGIRATLQIWWDC